MRFLLAIPLLLCSAKLVPAQTVQPSDEGARTAMPTQMPQRHPFGAEDTTTIRIRLINGRTGQPIAGKEIFLEREKARLMSHAEEKDIKTDASGIAEATVPKAGELLNPIVVDYHSCTPRLKHAGETEKALRFPVTQILSTGIIAQNTCGKLLQTAKPGELVLYYRTMNVFERITD